MAMALPVREADFDGVALTISRAGFPIPQEMVTAARGEIEGVSQNKAY